MQIICISRYSYGYGKELAEKLAKKLGYDSISREELADQAANAGIPIGKLETAILKNQLITEELSIEGDRFKAFISETLCRRALIKGIVYHGRIGHLLLPGLTNILRVRAIADEDYRISKLLQRMKLTREQAKKYIAQVDEDRRKYTKFFYNVNCDNASVFDVVINSAHMNVDNSAAALMHMAQLPDFQSTPALDQRMADLLLQSKCRLVIGEDVKTKGIKVNVSADGGKVTVTYLPRNGKQAEFIPEVLRQVEGVKSLICTVATTNILYVQEKFDPNLGSFNHLIEIANKWNASIELVRLSSQTEGEADASIPTPQREGGEGGILDDTAESGKEEWGIPETMEKLIQVGRAGASGTVYGGAQNLANVLKLNKNNSLVVVGDIFSSMGSAAKKRAKRDAIGQLAEASSAPVIGDEDLKEQYLFGIKQWINTFIYGALVVLIYFLVLTNQETILTFLTPADLGLKILAIAAILIFVPTAAFIISGFSHNVLKYIKLE